MIASILQFPSRILLNPAICKFVAKAEHYDAIKYEEGSKVRRQTESLSIQTVGIRYLYNTLGYDGHEVIILKIFNIQCCRDASLSGTSGTIIRVT